MNFYLLSYELNGIKNINKKISMQFYNKTLSNKIEIQGTNVKAIYGKNGSGKSGIINAVDAFQKIVSNKGFLYDKKGKGYLQELINYQTNELYLSFKFVLYTQKDKSPFLVGRYQIKVVRDLKKNDILIESETLSEIARTTGNENVIFKSTHGEIEESIFKDELNHKFINQLDKRSVLEIIKNDIYPNLTDNGNGKNIELIRDAVPFILFSANINVSLDDSDKHNYFLNMEYDFINEESNFIIRDSEINESKVRGEKANDNQELRNIMPKCLHFRIVNKKIQPSYIATTKKLCNFLQLFKSDLMNIKVDFRPYDSESDYADLYFEYEQGHTVYIDFESTGIKKLINLYEILVSLDEGGIAFIDEFDANIHDVFLVKIIEYFSEYSQGQLIFTTHNLSPMEVLSKKKHAIDFLTDNSELISWKKSGNYSVVKLYRQGLLKKLHFNTMASDFIGIFSEGEEDD